MKQTEKIYLISDAAKQVQVESHVLRYWEEELQLPIKRNELGHRFYTEEDIKQFKEIRDLKERGLQLRAIRTLLNKQPESMERHVVMVNKGEFVPLQEESREAKNYRLQKLLQNMIAEAVRSNNRELCDEMKESILKELDYQFRLQEEKEDEREAERVKRQEQHYREFDELLRMRSRKSGLKNREEKRAEKRAEKQEKALKEEQEQSRKREEKRKKGENPRQDMEQENGNAERETETEPDIQILTEEEQKKEKSRIGFLRKKRSII